MKSLLTGKDPAAGKDWGQEEKGATEDEIVGFGITDSMDMSLSKLCKTVKNREAWHTAVYGVTKSWLDMTEQLNNKYSNIQFLKMSI